VSKLYVIILTAKIKRDTIENSRNTSEIKITQVQAWESNGLNQ